MCCDAIKLLKLFDTGRRSSGWPYPFDTAMIMHTSSSISFVRSSQAHDTAR